MRVPITCLLVILIAACGGGDSANSAPAEGAAAADAGDLTSEELCEILQSGLLAEVFAVEADITFEPGDRTNTCTAKWPKPDLAEREALVKQKLAEWSDARITAMQKGEEFDQKIPYVRIENEVFINFEAVSGGPEVAVARLESVLKQITEGVAVETEDVSTVFRINYDEQVDNVGDKAAWASKLKQLSFAADGRIFHLQVKVHDDADANRDSAIELANRIIASL